MYHLTIKRQELDIGKILNSGQVFRYETISEGAVVLICSHNYVRVDYKEDGYDFHCSEKEFYTIWSPYLDLDRDYVQINKDILSVDSRLESLVKDSRGIRILQQDSFEMLFTFIVSQSKSIPQIRKLLNLMAVQYGKELATFDGKKVYGFPRAKDLGEIKEEAYRHMKFGYRGPYLEDAVYKTLLYMEEGIVLKNLDDVHLKERLLAIKGVGNKVAACVMLFGYARHTSFPIDVWMKRVMLLLYEEKIRRGLTNPKVKNISESAIEKYGHDLFGDRAGIAQQYLFEYGRNFLT